MYSIANVIYGIPLSAISNFLTEDELEEVYSDGSDLIEIEYSGNCENPGWCGVKLGEFDVVNDVKMSDLDSLFDYSCAQRLEAQNLIEQLHQTFPKTRHLKPEVWIVWSTS